ncbi:hypothetical protein [Rhizobium sp. NFR03]|uniref:SRPBCC family protein n=1 Tax=Rhizobium sp. NFR03 TaxID=1566263 RepID=UPI0008B30057|nr:hypothetical protein [Rhizobium sp. NFR03]SES46022.1 hypothetical protein SAMN03159406_04733 [Rhizobium sp. NFR03]
MNAVEHETQLDAAARAYVTIGMPAEELRTLWQRPDIQALIWADFADLTPVADRTLDWVAHGPAGGEYRWRTETAEVGANEIRWSSLDGADVPNVGSVTFHPAPGDRGTELHLEVKFDPPGGVVGEAVSKLFHVVPREIVLKALYRFRALAVTGEIPTTNPQPAARSGSTDR